MEIYSYGNAQASLQPSLYKTNRATSLEKTSRNENINSKEHKASLYTPNHKAQRLVKESVGLSNVERLNTLDSLNTADTYIEKLQAILSKLKETNIPEIAKEIPHLKDGLKEVLDKFPMLRATITKVANWDIKTFLGGRGEDAGGVLRQMKEDIALIQMEVKASSSKDILRSAKGDAAKVNLLISSLGGSKDSTLHNNLSTNRVVDLIT